ncbi:MAG: TetR family transcriptional regulator [Streptosporangiales bacterium]|nr:TetR family transcriptional regulator [Streptosporangiales bacterium]
MWYMPTSAAGSPRERLLAAATAYVAEHGLGAVSLRQLATALGTSHRMLIYHFGSRDGLLVEVVRAVEQRQRAAFAELLQGAGDEEPLDVMRRLWRRFVDTSQAPYERLFFELYGRALQGDPAAAPLLDGIVASWLPPLTELCERAGFDPETAQAQARLQVAVTRGLLLDLLATGDRTAVQAAIDHYVDMLELRLAASARRQ